MQQSEKRKFKRHDLNDAVHVYDRVSQTFLGRLVNIHTEGLLIMGNFPFSDERIYQIDLHLPESDSTNATISMGVECLWTRAEDEERAYWAGCKIIDISDDALTQLQNLIRLFADT